MPLPVTGTFPAATPDLAPLRVLVIDGSRLFAEGLRRRLMLEPDVDTAATATSTAEALRLLGELPIGVIVTSAPLALELYAAPDRRLRWRSNLLVIVLADSADTEHAKDLFRLGIVGWIGRDRSTADLLDAIRRTRQGQAHVDIDVLPLLTDGGSSGEEQQTGRDRVLSVLSHREMQVFLLLEQGMNRSEIAAALHLSPNTIRTHIHRILRRLNVHSTLAALAAARNGDAGLS